MPLCRHAGETTPTGSSEMALRALPRGPRTSPGLLFRPTSTLSTRPLACRRALLSVVSFFVSHVAFSDGASLTRCCGCSEPVRVRLGQQHGGPAWPRLWLDRGEVAPACKMGGEWAHQAILHGRRVHARCC